MLFGVVGMQEGVADWLCDALHIIYDSGRHLARVKRAHGFSLHLSYVLHDAGAASLCTPATRMCTCEPVHRHA